MHRAQGALHLHPTRKPVRFALVTCAMANFKTVGPLHLKRVVNRRADPTRRLLLLGGLELSISPHGFMQTSPPRGGNTVFLRDTPLEFHKALNADPSRARYTSVDVERIRLRFRRKELECA